MGMDIDFDKLREYKGKRDFSKTPEPAGKKGGEGGAPVFVIQQHDASHMHWDFRLETESGVLVSWAVPKGPSTDPSNKRLAVRTEDHPLEYARFEGVIPKDEYGGGTVIVWDAGEFENRSEKDGRSLSLEKALDKGHARVWLKGSKLRGGYSLIHTRMRGDERNWLFIKEDDEEADARRNPVSTEPESVLSGLTVKEMAEAMAEREGGAS
ncbi:DNA polymerase ligase N-terminal domain-containing protein [Desulfohalovibrio reitneri]|uniref:DNA polymerase ligase N-terminal domain-containing protein n=1 Tax=Desulfohalovibrio reitneri TaxID=1307759 RepID=UPI0004A72EA6|nr:DNA polymerase ligase N-terminal domain-containing protein [Desulfohalovibrio reitneri]